MARPTIKQLQDELVAKDREIGQLRDRASRAETGRVEAEAKLEKCGNACAALEHALEQCGSRLEVATATLREIGRGTKVSFGHPARARKALKHLNES